MRKNILLWALLFSLLCGLCACGGGSGGATGELERGISDNHLNREQQTLTELDSEPEGIHGLIFVDYMGHVIHYTDGLEHVVINSKDDSVVRVINPGDEVVDYLDGTTGFEGHGYAIYCLNPDTGKVTKISAFYYPAIGDPYTTELLRENNPFIEGHPGWWFHSPYPARKYFSDDYSKMACEICVVEEVTKYSHVGWIDTNSKFFDVTEALALNADMYNSVDGFSGNFFGYSIGRSGDDGTYYVPIDDISPEKIQEGDIHTIDHPYDEDGRLMGFRYTSESVTSWLDDTRAIVNSGSYTSRQSIIANINTGTSERYIPEHFGDTWIEETWNGTASPDGSKIAFMSNAGVYIIPMDGGEPIKVEVPDVLATRLPSDRTQPKEYERWTLIDWQ